MAEWRVLLGGKYVAYDDVVQRKLEAAYAGDVNECEVTVRGTDYVILLQLGRQEQRNDRTKRRPVQRVPASDAPSRKRQRAESSGAAASSGSAAASSSGAADDNATTEEDDADATEDETEEDEPAAASSAAAAAAKHVFVFAPGAGGNLAQDMVKMHAVLRARDECAGVRGMHGWPSGPRPTAQNNLQHVVDAAHAAALAHPGATVHLCGASMGCRVVAEVARHRRAELPASVSRTLVLTGYPLIGPDGSMRDGHLRNLPADTRVLFVQGDTDEFLRGRGIAALRGVIAGMPCGAQVHVVRNGGHSVPKCTGLRQMGLTAEGVSKQVVGAVMAFVA